ncbi:MAG: arsenosugar biosynthesis radical SAM (seleno)protein ArsS [Gammaproteobacteria bacterium]
MSFTAKLKQHDLQVDRKLIDVLQINVGKKCNQACHHCHVDAGPKRTEQMSKAIFDQLLTLLKDNIDLHTIDLTGGAPELNSNFRYFVSEARALGKHVIDRCNLTVLFEPGQEDTAEFLCDNQVEIICSLPCYSRENLEKQRGKGVFGKSIRALQKLNALGYGKADSNLRLNLVYNPLGATLPPAQPALEAQYKQVLKDDFDITFNQLYTITNVPINRFKHLLVREDKLAEYMQLLIDNFNPQAALGVMCTHLISIAWDGRIYDCDFNQMLDLPIKRKQRSIMDVNSLSELCGEIAFANHCFACTAGCGSSCGGALVS